MPRSASSIVQWKIHLASSPEKVHNALSTDKGRAGFWAEETEESAGRIRFRFPNGMTWEGAILQSTPNEAFAVEYFGSMAEFRLEPDGKGGTDLTLTDTGVAAEHYDEVHAGWISVLMALKAYVDHGVDLRNHDPGRTWDQGYADN